jgi:peroxiredoxin
MDAVRNKISILTNDSKMKRLIYLTVLLAGVLGTQAKAQLPAVAEDISPLLIGEQVPDIVLNDIQGNPHSLLELAAEQPTILVTYRGGWCYFCNVHLADLASVESEIADLGYQLVAVSPDIPDSMASTSEKNHLKAIQLSDPEGELIKGLGLAFQATESLMQRLLTYSGGENDSFIPVPALFVLDPEGHIRFEYINPNFRVRIKGAFLVDVLKSIDDQDQAASAGL